MADWALCSMALFRGDLDAASEFLAKASPSSADPNEVLDPDGPLPYPEGWKRAFFEGTIRLLGGVRGRGNSIDGGRAIEADPEGANNLGVALHRKGREDDCMAQFALASRRSPGYRDALLNQRSEDQSKLITTHPIRSHASRNQY